MPKMDLLGFTDPNTWTASNVFGNEAPRLGPGPQARVGPCRVQCGACGESAWSPICDRCGGGLTLSCL